MMQSANTMIVLDDYSNNNSNNIRGSGGGNNNNNNNDSILNNDHNPFNTDHRLRRSGAVSTVAGTGSSFVTPPDRIRHDPLRVLLQQLQNDGNSNNNNNTNNYYLPDNEDIHNAIMNVAPGDVASFILGNNIGGGVGNIENSPAGMSGEFHFTTNNSHTPGFGGRMGSIRPPETQGQGQGRNQSHEQGQGHGQGDLSSAIRYVILKNFFLCDFSEYLLLLSVDYYHYHHYQHHYYHHYYQYHYYCCYNYYYQ